jgi:bifunctional non-homologous end joining protein LigD
MARRVPPLATRWSTGGSAGRATGRARRAESIGRRPEMGAPSRRRATAGSTGGPSDLAEYRRKRDFERSPEPSGGEPARAAGELRFVVQKHAARRLHFDLRLEVGGVMKSWAVPKGPSLDPSVKRLAVEVEDHPMEYNRFEGTIPAGEYGGGTVMLWDRGSYTVDGLRAGGDAEKAMRSALRAGKLSVTFHGERLRGSFGLVRTRPAESDKPQWLLFKHQDEFADPERDIVGEIETSVDSGRTMEEIAGGVGGRRVWRRDDGDGTDGAAGGDAGERQALTDPSFSPMLASSAPEPPLGESWTYEPKWDGIRVLGFATAEAAALITRNGNDKRKQFPEVSSALRELAASAGSPLVLDGEIVGTRDGEIVRFESLQGRMHSTDPSSIRRHARDAPAAFVAFDILVEGDTALIGRPWSERRTRLEAALADPPPRIILGDSSRELEPMLELAREQGWEGLIAKRIDARYQPGKRSRDWRKIKLENRQEFVVGGWTEPRNSRKHIGALLLGYFDEAGGLRYAGHTGTGLTDEALANLASRLKRLERKTPPFTPRPKTNERPHWTTPRVVVEVRFNEWTSKGMLRQPVFVGVRDDKDPREVVREPPAGAAPAARPATETSSPSDTEPAPRPPPAAAPTVDTDLLEQLDQIEEGSGSGTITLPRRRKLEVTNLDKIFFPRVQQTKGDLLRYYASLQEYLLPFMKDRPLVLKRFPDGESGKAFYQQNAGDNVPPGVRVESLIGEDGQEQRRFVGGDLPTLLYTVQLGAISYDPWHSRVGRLDFPDYTILDLDPGPDTAFATVVEVARAVHQEMIRLGLHGAIKTSGATGLHIYLPLPPRTPLQAATLVAQIVATRVAATHPHIATVERMTRNRPKGTVYVDYLQNILGKTVAGVYAVRAMPLATVSTPLLWSELADDLDPAAFTMQSLPARLSRTGEIWGAAMKPTNSLKNLLPRP